MTWWLLPSVHPLPHCALPGFVSLCCSELRVFFFSLLWTSALPLEPTSAQCVWFNACLISPSGLPLSGCLTHRFMEVWADAERGRGTSSGMGMGGPCGVRKVGGHHLCAMFKGRRWKGARIPFWIFISCLWNHVCCILDLPWQTSCGIPPCPITLPQHGCQRLLPRNFPGEGWCELPHLPQLK